MCTRDGQVYSVRATAYVNGEGWIAEADKAVFSLSLLLTTVIPRAYRDNMRQLIKLGGQRDPIGAVVVGE